MLTNIARKEPPTRAIGDGPASAAASPSVFLETAGFHRIMASDARVVILSAPAGYGKSSLLSALATSLANQGLRCAWQGAEVAAADRSLAEADMILMDDAHLSKADRFIQIVRSACADGSSQRLFIATRSLPEADWFSFQARGLLDIIRPEELAMTRAETAAMLRHYAGADPSPAQVDQIDGLIEGWPIAAQWYGMLARRKGGWSRLTIGTPQTHDDLGRYLNEMVHAELDEETRASLFDIADLERLLPDMPGDILVADGSRMLQRLRRENLLVQDEAGIMKLHGLLQNFLEAKRLETGRSRNVPLLDSACAWASASGLQAEAVDFAIRAGNLDAAHDLLTRHCEEIVNVRGELPGMLRWTDQLRRAGIALAPTLALWRAWALILAGELSRAEQELVAVRDSLSPEADAALHLHADRLELSLAARRRTPEEVIEIATRWIARWGEVDPFHLAATSVLRALAHHAQGQVLAAQRDLATAQRAALACEGLYARMWVAKAEAYISLRTGRVVAARDTLLAAIDLIRRDGTVAQSTLGTLHLLVSRIFVELRDFPRAREHLAAGHLHMGDTGLVEIHLAASEAAMLIAEEESLEAARRELQLHQAANLRASVERDLFVVRLLLRHGRNEDARESFETAFTGGEENWRHVAHNSAVPASLLPALRTVRAQLLFAQGAFRDAAALAARLLPLADTRGNIDDHLAILFVSAGSAHKDAQPSQARRFLGRALRLAADRAAFQGAFTTSWPIRTLLGDYEDLDEGLRNDALALLEGIRKHHGIRAESAEDDTPVDPLTPRETEVLWMLDTGLSSDAIADHLAMGGSTVKWHVRNIYAKLGVRNRSGALARARRLGMIQDLAL